MHKKSTTDAEQHCLAVGDTRNLLPGDEGGKEGSARPRYGEERVDESSARVLNCYCQTSQTTGYDIVPTILYGEVKKDTNYE